MAVRPPTRPIHHQGAKNTKKSLWMMVAISGDWSESKNLS